MIFTIAIPTYNNARTLSKTIESCINQNYDNNEYEVIVVDNASTDDTAEILKRFKDIVTIYRNDETYSMYENHNICLEKANGEYIIFCHSDDTLLNDTLFKIDDRLKKRGYPNKYVVWGRSMYRDFKNEWDRSNLPLDSVLSGEESFKVFVTGGLTPSGTCYSTKAFRDLDGFYLVYSKSAPSDTISYWKLIVNQFEFEMCSRIFFSRTEASTAIGENFTKSKRINALIESYKTALDDDTVYKKYIYRYYKSTTQNIIADIALCRNNIYNNRRMITHYFSQFIKSPSKKTLVNFYTAVKWL